MPKFKINFHDNGTQKCCRQRQQEAKNTILILAYNTNRHQKHHHHNKINKKEHELQRMKFPFTLSRSSRQCAAHSKAEFECSRNKAHKLCAGSQNYCDNGQCRYEWPMNARSAVPSAQHRQSSSSPSLGSRQLIMFSYRVYFIVRLWPREFTTYFSWKRQWK